MSFQQKAVHPGPLGRSDDFGLDSNCDGKLSLRSEAGF